MSKSIEIQERIAASNNYNKWIVSAIYPYLGNRILDVGSGLGNIVSLFPVREKNICIDILDDAVKILKAKFGSTSKVFKLDICHDEAAEIIKGEMIDTITCINTLEHIYNDTKALRNMYDIVSKGGHLILLTPALQILYGTLDKADNHFRRYNKKDLNYIVEKAGFEIIRQHYMNIFGIITWFLAGRVFRLKFHYAGVNKILDKITVFLRGIEDAHPPFIGQSLVTICRK